MKQLTDKQFEHFWDWPCLKQLTPPVRQTICNHANVDSKYASGKLMACFEEYPERVKAAILNYVNVNYKPYSNSISYSQPELFESELTYKPEVEPVAIFVSTPIKIQKPVKQFKPLTFDNDLFSLAFADAEAEVI